MLNFLFEGAIGELLAPVSSPFHQLQLAIQRHENEKVSPAVFAAFAARFRALNEWEMDVFAGI